MNGLVELRNGKEPVVRSFDIWEKFGYKEHLLLKRVILKNKSSFEEHGFLHLEMQKPPKGSKGGRPDESYLLNESHFTLLVMLVKNTPESVEIKQRIVKEFFRMRTMLAQLASTHSGDEWKNIRQDGKVIYHQKTDAIKNFIDYAISQGSQSANRYYKNLADMENKALFLMEQKFPNIREVLNVRQLGQVMVADQIVEKALEEGMNLGLHYKEIFVLAKDRVVKFSEILGKSQVIETLESPKLIKG